MTARTVLRVALLSLAFALAARALGWWSSAVLGLVWGALGTRRPVMEAGIAAVVGWLGLLALAAGPEFVRLVGVLGRLGPIPGGAYPAFALVAGGLLAALGAAVTAGPRRDQLFQHETAAGSDS